MQEGNSIGNSIGQSNRIIRANPYGLGNVFECVLSRNKRGYDLT